MKHEQTWPAVIYLQHGATEVPPFKECSEVSWAEENIHGNDVKYIRAKGSRTHSGREAELTLALTEAARSLGQIRNLTTAPAVETSRVSTAAKIYAEHDAMICEIAHEAATKAFQATGDSEGEQCSLRGGNYVRDRAALSPNEQGEGR